MLEEESEKEKKKKKKTKTEVILPEHKHFLYHNQ